MFQTPIADALYRKLASSPPGWMSSRDGRQLIARALRLVRAASQADARYMRNLLTTATAFNRLTGA